MGKLFKIDNKPNFLKISNDRKLWLIELFAGYGSQAMALKRAGIPFEHHKVVEFDSYACDSYNAVHGTTFVPTDICTIHADDLEIVDTDKFTYLVTYSYPCFTEDTLVLTNSGYKSIATLTTDDYVLTHMNKYQKVLACKKTGDKKTYVINAMGIDSLQCTENHKFYVRKFVRHYPTLSNGKRTSIRKFNTPEWVECKDLDKSYYLGVAINQNSLIPTWNGIDFSWSDGRADRHKNSLSQYMTNPEFWELLGMYVGDGWHRSQGGIIICGNNHKVDKITNLADNLGLHYLVVKERTVYKVHFANKEFEAFVEPFGVGAKNKHIPGFIFDMPTDLIDSFLRGYISADGTYNSKTNLYRTSSVSRELTYGIAQLVAKAYKVPYRIYKHIGNKTTTIEGRVVNQNPYYTVCWKRDKKKQDKAFYENGYVWFPIRSITESDIQPVYDIETEQDHSFTANGVIVHNCQDLSVAGHQRGMIEGSGTRSSLLWEVKRILSECTNLPQVLMMENVPAVHNKDNAAEFQRWIDFLSGLGYKSTWHDLNAKDFGVPQQRVRTFMFSILDGSYSYVWPKPILLEKRLKDILEDRVDEKYYIGDERAKKLIDNLIEREVLKSTDDHQVPVDGTLNEPNIKTVANALDAKDRGIDVRKCVRNVVVQNVE